VVAWSGSLQTDQQKRETWTQTQRPAYHCHGHSVLHFFGSITLPKEWLGEQWGAEEAVSTHADRAWWAHIVLCASGPSSTLAPPNDKNSFSATSVGKKQESQCLHWLYIVVHENWWIYMFSKHKLRFLLDQGFWAMILPYFWTPQCSSQVMIKMADSPQGPTFIDWLVQGHTICKLSLPHTLPAPQNLICRFLQLVFVREYRGLMNLEMLQYRVMQ
jgi:hypothetical protein